MLLFLVFLTVFFGSSNSLESTFMGRSSYDTIGNLEEGTVYCLSNDNDENGYTFQDTSVEVVGVEYICNDNDKSAQFAIYSGIDEPENREHLFQNVALTCDGVWNSKTLDAYFVTNEIENYYICVYLPSESPSFGRLGTDTKYHFRKESTMDETLGGMTYANDGWQISFKFNINLYYECWDIREDSGACSDHGNCTYYNTCECSGNFDGNECDNCINQYLNYSMDCEKCLNDPDDRKEYPSCNSCKNGYHLFSDDCYSCINDPEGRKVFPSCQECINDLQDIDEDCGVCLNDLYERKNFPLCDKCTVETQDYTDNCETCENDPYNRKIQPECEICSDYWEGDDCTTCPALYEQSECKVCINGMQDPTTGCLTCLHDESDLRQYPECDVCINQYRDPTVGIDCTKCKNPNRDAKNQDDCYNCINVLQDPEDNCLSCLSDLFSYESGCSTCINEKYNPARMNYPTCDACKNTLQDFSTNCEYCIDDDEHLKKTPDCDKCNNVLFDFDNDCLTCSDDDYGRKNYPSCTKCSDYWVFSSGCKICPSGYNANCDDCENTVFDPEQDCEFCRNDDLHLVDPDTDCTACVNIDLDYDTYFCQRCKNDDGPIALKDTTDCKCINPTHDIDTDCSTCLFDPNGLKNYLGQTSGGCDKCIDPNQDFFTNCSTCLDDDFGYKNYPDNCDSCTSSLHDINYDCTRCLNDDNGEARISFPNCDECIDENHNFFFDCRVCKGDVGTGINDRRIDYPDCDVCVNELHDIAYGCGRCLNDPHNRKNYPDCDSCINNWNFSTHCEECENEYFDVTCSECSDSNHNIEYLCTQCTLGEYVSFPSCDECVYPYHDFLDRCESCLYSDDLVFPDCSECTNPLRNPEYPYYCGVCIGDEGNNMYNEDCTACENELYDMDTNCTTCLGDPGNLFDYPLCTSCVNNLLNIEYDCDRCINEPNTGDSVNNLISLPNCDECVNPLRNIANYCETCLNDPGDLFSEDCSACDNRFFDKEYNCLRCVDDLYNRKNYPDCSTCIDYWTIKSDCESCINTYFNEDCDACADSNHDIDNNCITCTNPLLNFPNCMNCNNNLQDPDEDCLECKNDPSSLKNHPDCDECINNLQNYSENCLVCSNDENERKNYPNCDECKDYWVYSTDCEECVSEYFNDDCNACSSSLHDINYNCKRCLNDPSNNKNFPSCTACKEDYWDFDDKCQSCKNGGVMPGCTYCLNQKKNISDNCESCLNDPFGLMNNDCSDCLNSNQDFSDNCQSCEDPGKNLKTYPTCSSCLNDKFDIANNCLSCDGQLDNTDRAWNYPQCDDCENSYQDFSKNCAECENDPSSLKKFPECNVCKNSAKDFSTNCEECNNDIYNRKTSDCSDCVDYWVISTDCEDCENSYFNEECDACSDPLKDVEELCLKCLNDPFGRKNFPDCEKCINDELNITTDCVSCKNDVLGLKEKPYCLSCIIENQDIDNDCLTCLDDENNLKAWPGCNTCTNPKFDINYGCERCIGDTNNRMNYPLCTECINPLQDFDDNCNSCIFDDLEYKKFPSCGSCLNQYQDYSLNCTECTNDPDGRKIYPACDSCIDENHDFDGDCYTCLNDPYSRKSYPDCECIGNWEMPLCDVCINRYDSDNNCETCVNHFDIETECTECEESYELPDCDITYGSEGCEGSSDICFTLDGSSSINDYDWRLLKNFTKGIVESLNSYSSIALVQFGYQTNDGLVKVEANMTDNHTSLLKIVDKMNKGDGSTPFHLGLEKCYEQFELFGREGVQKFIIALTDGKTWNEELDIEETDRLENNFGALVMGIGVGSEFDIPHIKDDVSSDEILFVKADNFTELLTLVDIISQVTCTDVYRLNPNSPCAGSDAVIQVVGVGFLDLPGLVCVFNGKFYEAEYINNYIVECTIPWEDTFKVDYFYNLEISLNGGVSYSSGNKPLLYYDCESNITNTLDCTCYGKSDIVFVLDTSYSVDNDEWALLRDFTYNVSKQICIDSLFSHISVIQFTTDCLGNDFNGTSEGEMAQIILDLDGDGADKLESLRIIKNLGRCGSGGTPLHYGLQLALEQFQTSRSSVQQYVVVVTDGITDSCKGIRSSYPYGTECDDCIFRLSSSETKNSSEQEYWSCTPSCCYDDRNIKQELEDFGAIIFGIAVGSGDEIDKKYVKYNISTDPAFFASVNSFSEIQNVIDSLVEQTCIDIFFIDPSETCVGEDETFEVRGMGYMANVSDVRVWCRLNNNTNLTVLGEIVSDSKILCPFEWALLEQYGVGVAGEYVLEVAVRDITKWTESGEIVTYKDCSEFKFPFLQVIPGIIGGLLCILLILSTLLLLSMCAMKNSKRAKVTTHELLELESTPAEPLPEPEPEPEPEEFTPAPVAPRETYYLGGRAMTVDWKDNVSYDKEEDSGDGPESIDEQLNEWRKKKEQMNKKQEKPAKPAKRPAKPAKRPPAKPAKKPPAKPAKRPSKLKK